MELIQYIRLFRRWFWLIFLTAFIGGSVSFIVRSQQPPTYEAQATILIGGFIDDPNPDRTAIGTGEVLAATYVQLVRTFDVLQATVDSLNLPLTADQLRSRINTRIISGTSLLVVSLTYTDPVLAADIVNELTRQIILRSPTNLTTEQQSQIDFLNSQIRALTTELNSLRQTLTQVDEQISNTRSTDTATLAQLSERRTTLINQINEASSNIAQFTTTIANLQRRTNSVEIIESARIPTNTTGSSVLNVTLLGAMVGAALAFGGVLLLEYLNDTFRSADEITQGLNVPVLGVVSRFGKRGEAYNTRLITKQPLLSRTPEEYRTLRTNMLFSADPERKVFVVSSATPQEGKSVTAANLAVSLALAGVRVLLVDADLRRPRVHEIFNLPNELGLTSLLSMPPGEASDDTGKVSDRVFNANTWKQCVQTTSVPGLQVITCGFIPKNPTEILGSALMKRWAEVFQKSPNIDVVIFDTPPCLALSDSTVLAASINAQVVLVIEAQRTRRAAAMKAKERFTQVNVDVLGVVLNGADSRQDDYYGYGYGYYYSSNTEPKK